MGSRLLEAILGPKPKEIHPLTPFNTCCRKLSRLPTVF